MTAMEGVVLRRTTTAQQVADALSARVLGGGFGAGDRLRESAIAADLGVSRNTVREAVRILELGGLVRYEVNRGAVVISPTQDSVNELYVARDRIERAAAARPATDEHLARLSQSLDDLQVVAATRDARQIVPLDLAFHASIVAMLDSARLDAFFADLTHELRFYLMVLSVQDREHEDPDGLVREHQVIFDAIASRDPVEAVAAVSQHIEVNRARVLQIVAQWGED